MRGFENIEEAFERIALEAQRVEVEFDTLLVQKTDDHAFAVHGRHGRDTQIQLLALHLKLDAAVLRQAALGNVELGHDLDARNDRGGRSDRRRFHLLEYAIDPEAHLQDLLEGFDVDVGGPHLHGALHDQIDHADDRGLGGQVLEMLDIGLVDIVVAAEGIGNFAHQRLARPQLGFQGAVDFGAQSDPCHDGAVARQGNGVEEFLMKGVGYRHDNFLVVGGQADHVVFLQEPNRYRFRQWRTVGVIVRHHQRTTADIRQDLGRVAL